MYLSIDVECTRIEPAVLLLGMLLAISGISILADVLQDIGLPR